MTPEQIEILFHETINKKEAYGKALYNLLDGVTENQIYNWRKLRTKPTVGDMLNVLYQLKKIKIDVNTNANDIVSMQISIMNRAEEHLKKAFSPEMLPKFRYTQDSNEDEGFKHTLVIQGEPQPEPVLDKNGDKKTLKFVPRPNSNSK